MIYVVMSKVPNAYIKVSIVSISRGILIIWWALYSWNKYKKFV